MKRTLFTQATNNNKKIEVSYDENALSVGLCFLNADGGWDEIDSVNIIQKGEQTPSDLVQALRYALEMAEELILE